MIFSIMTLCSVVLQYQSFGEKKCLQIQGTGEPSWENKRYPCTGLDRPRELQAVEARR